MSFPKNDLNNSCDMSLFDFFSFIISSFVFKEIIKPRDHPRRPREVSSKIPVPKFRTVYPNERINKQK